MKVEIPFKHRFKDSLLNDTKTWTSRNKRYGKPRDTFDVFGHTFEILKVEQRPLANVGFFFKEEGFSSFDDFYNFWISIHPCKGFVPTQRVFVHVFRRIN